MYSTVKPVNYNKKAIKKSLKKYELIKKTDPSDRLHDPIMSIIRERKECFSSQASFVDRNSTCGKNYLNSYFKLARQNIKSAPMPGMFIRCIKECPISGSLCKGEEGMTDENCIEMEAKCIEYCLDVYWRGGTFPQNNNYMQTKNKD